jgi:RNA polymerase sigma factor (sigma-70 family)
MKYDHLMGDPTHGELLGRASRGDQSAWNDLVDRFDQMVWSVARSFRLDEATAKDVAQTTWLKLVENISKIQDPERLPGWLATTCRREAIRVSKLRDRVIPTEFEYDVEDESTSLEVLLVEDEESRNLVTAFQKLSEGCQQLLRLLTVEPALSYDEIAETTGRPVGSLGPTRARCIDRLKTAIGRIREASGPSFGEGDN